MNQSQKFTEDDIPYNILNRFGFTREMIEDMPDAILKKLKDGHTTPVLPIQVTADNGDKILSAARLSLYRNEAGEVRVMFYPKLEKAELSRFSPQQQKSHNDGGPIVSDMTMPDGKKAPAFFLIDHETNVFLFSANMWTYSPVGRLLRYNFRKTCNRIRLRVE